MIALITMKIMYIGLEERVALEIKATLTLSSFQYVSGFLLFFKVLFLDQEKMAGELCRAFETAGATPPPELKAMFEKFVAEMKEQGKEVHLGDKGFHGSGYKHNDEEAESEANKKMMSRLVGVF